MARLRVTGNRFSKNSIVGITLLVVAVVAIAALVVAAVVLPRYADVTEYTAPEVVSIVMPNNGMISVNADQSQVYAIVKYSNGESKQVALSELIVKGLDTTSEGTCENVVLNFGGYEQIVDFKVVPTELTVEYSASTGGRVEGETIQKVTAGENADRVEAIADEGYYFAGWSDGNLNASRLDTQISKSEKLIATFKKIEYSVVFFYPDGTTAREQMVKYGESPMYVPRASEKNMELYGYRFTGWDTDFSSITQDTNVHPEFEKYAVDFNLEYTVDKSGRPLGTSDALTYYEFDELATVRIQPNSERMFVGWSIFNVDQQVWVDLGTEDVRLIPVAPGEAVEFVSERTSNSESYVLSFTPQSSLGNNSEIKIKAHFVYLESEISFTSMNNSVFDRFVIGHDTPIGEKFDVEDLTKLSTHGYSFEGWYVEGAELGADGKPVFVTNETKFTQPAELVAYWEKRVFTAVFLRGENEDAEFLDPANGYDATLGGQVVTAYYQDSLAGVLTGAFPEAIPQKANHAFKGWYLADADLLPTNVVVDRTFKLQDEICYFIPVFEVNTKSLTVGMQGSGKISTLVYDAQYDEYAELAINGRVNMPVTEDYAIRIRPSEGYTLVSVTVNGATTSSTNLAPDGYYDVTISSIISTDYVINAVFKLTEYDVSITNGSEFTSTGTLVYGVLGGTETKTTTAIAPSIAVSYGSGLSLEITPESGFYISGLTLNGKEVTLPTESTYYNLIIENIVSANSVVITYREFKFTMALPTASENGIIYSDSNMLTFDAGDVASFTIQAEEGYYIRSLSANGTIIDPYSAPSSYTITETRVNGVLTTARSAENDYRITTLKFNVNSVSENVTFAVEFQKLYYNVTTHYDGIGSVDAPFTTEFGSSFQVKASTSNGYFVYSVVVNGEEILIPDALTAYQYNVNGANKDYDVKFIFKRTVYYVNFTDASNTAPTVEYGDRKFTVRNPGYTVNEIEHATSATFKITAPSGYYINAITVNANDGRPQKDEVINYSVSQYELTLTSVTASYNVKITCEAINLKYNLYFINKGDNVVNINNQNIAEDVYSASIAYGSDLSVGIALRDNYDLKIDNVLIKNHDDRDTVEYLPLDVNATEEESKSYYALISASGQTDKTLNVKRVRSEIDVYVYFESTLDANTVSYAFNGSGTLVATNELGSVASGSTQILGSTVTFKATPQTGYEIERFIVNGTEIALDDLNNGAYDVTVEKDTFVYVSFSKTAYKVTVTSGITNGVVATDKTLVVSGDSLKIKLTPVEGYEVSLLEISVLGSDIVYQPLNSENVDTTSGMIEYEFASANITGDVTVKAAFAPIEYTFTYSYNLDGRLEGVGDGGSTKVAYGYRLDVKLIANAGFYISSIILNGESVAPQTLSGNPVIRVTGEYTEGTLRVDISGDANLEVTFSPLVYSITVSESIGGETLVNNLTGNSGYVPANEQKLSAGDNLALKLMAKEGYHVEELRINGIVITSWQDANMSKNDRTDLLFDYKDDSVLTVSDNIVVRVIYAVNEYQIKVNVTNVSPNFSSVDVDPNTFGTVSITGYTAGENNVYTGFTHGSKVKFVVTPRTARGYYISRFELVYFKDGEEVPPVVIPSSVLAETGGSYVMQDGIDCDIQAVNVEFSRRVYEYSGVRSVESLGSPKNCEGVISATFTNPYSNQPVVLVDGKYEYGLNFNVSVNPGTGYSRTAFTVNGENRLSSVRNNTYIGTVTGSLIIDVEYTINTYTLDMTATSGGEYYVYDATYNDDINGYVLLWSPDVVIINAGEEIPQDKWTYSARGISTGYVWATQEGLTVTYGTEVMLVAIPESESGFRTQAFYVNGQARTVADEDNEMRVGYSVQNDVNVEIVFTIHTYRVEVNTFEGGVAQVSSSVVNWRESVTITLIIEKGYQMDVAEVYENGVLAGNYTNELCDANGENGGSYRRSIVEHNIKIEITLKHKPYDVTFTGDYKNEYAIATAKTEVKATSGVVLNQNSNLKPETSYGVNDLTIDSSGKGILIGKAAYLDKMTVLLTLPVGYKITTVYVTMDDNGSGSGVQNLVLSEKDLDVDDGSGTRTYTIQSLTGDVTIHVEYAIKQYKIIYQQRSGGSYYSMGTTEISHHELFTVQTFSDNGYYLANLDINGRSVPTTHEKNGMGYRYSTDTKDANGNLTQLNIDDILVNGQDSIVITPTYEKQRFEVIFYVGTEQITSVSENEIFQKYGIKLSIENNEIIYDSARPAVITQELTEGYSIASISLYNRPEAQGGESYSFLKSGRDYNVFTAKGTSLSVTLDRDIFAIMDYHSTNSRVMRFYYETSRDEHKSTSSMYLVESKKQYGVTTNVGQTIETAPARSFSLLASFNDGMTSEYHDYGTEAMLSVSVIAQQDYSFQGFQEKINGVWSYCVNGVNGVTIQSNGTELRYTMTANREFRAVFFRLYEIEVQIHPEYKYVEGSFASNNPNNMRYRLYANLTASATYVKDDNNGVILPNLPMTGSTMIETLTDVDGNAEDATYTFRVLSGARLVFIGTDRISDNRTKSYNYSVVEEDGQAVPQFEDSYTTNAGGVETLVDRVIHAYFNNDMYVSFAMETLGSTSSGEGGTVRYAVNGASVGSLSNNSLKMTPNQTLTITITPNANFKYVGIKQLLPLSESTSDGYRQFMSSYTPLEATEDGKVQITETANGGAVITINNLNENSIYKIEFVKMIYVTSSISLITDESGEEGPMPSYTITYKKDSTPSGFNYEYGSVINYNMNFSLGMEITDEYRRPYQFVGYFINGVNTYTQLVQNYPNNYAASFVLNNLDNLPNGVNIVEKTTSVGNVVTTSYVVDVVAKFVPVYNVVIENEYFDSGDYLNPGQITASTVMYDQDLTQYFTSSANVEPKLGADVSYNTDSTFQMLGKLNAIENENKNTATSKYNTWNDNMVTLTWAGAAGSGDSFAFVAWQYYAYNAAERTFEWRNIPYVDSQNATNLVTSANYSFPISCLFSTTYPAVIGNGGEIDGRYLFDASVYDFNGQYAGSMSIPAIRIRPKFQKVETLEIIKSTAMETEDIFKDGEGDVEPQINGTALPSGEFNYYTVQTLLPLEKSGYEFVGWYITENGQGGHQALLGSASELSYDVLVNANDTYYFVREEILNQDDSGSGTYITYNYNSANKQLNVLMDGSFKIYARYVRIYTINVNVANISGYSPMLSEALPTVNYYKKVGDNWELQAEYSGSTRLTIDDARVGSSVLFTLSTNYSGLANDSIRFNPAYDRFYSITSVNEYNQNVWNANGSNDWQNSYIPSLTLTGTDKASLDAYNSAINDDMSGAFDANDKTHIYAVITANAQKTVTFNFESFGTLVLHNVYEGSSIRLPSVLGEELYKQDQNSVELAVDQMDTNLYYVKDGGIGDADGVKDGNVTIINIPIRESRSFDGEVSGDYATRLIDTANILASDSISIGINFDGAGITNKVQHVAYYGTASWTEYKWVDGSLNGETVEKTSRYVKPFAGGSGTESDPFLIATIEHLRNVDGLYKGNYGSFVYASDSAGNPLRIHFKQIADICLSEANNFLIEPLCAPFTDEYGTARSNGFNGVYDGNNYYLYDLQFALNNSNITSDVGIFSRIYRGGVVKNIKLGKASITSNATNVGIVAGSVFGGTVENVFYDDACTIDSDNITNTIIGANFVGGLVGLISGENEQRGVIRNSSVSDMMIIATIGGTFLGEGSDFTGGAGGIVGSIGSYGSVEGINGGYTVDAMNVRSVVGAGGIVGTIQASQSAHTALVNVYARDVSLASEENLVAIGGVAGAIGANRTISNADVKIESVQAIISSQRAENGFSVEAVKNFLSYGAGGIVGYNNGTVTGSDLTTTGDWLLQLKGSMVGGIVGVNRGNVNSSTVKARLYTSRLKTTAHEGGAYGAVAGYNEGTITAVTASSLNSATDDYNPATSLYEVVTSGNSVYVPSSGPNSSMHGDAGSDTTTVFVGGLAGYNKGTVSGTVNGKILVNRRSNDLLSNTTYIAAGAAYSENANITVSGTSIIRLMHYLYVDPSDVTMTVYASIGNARGNSTGGSTSANVTADVTYIGGGVTYNSASFEAGFTWGYVGTGYLSGVAQVDYYGTFQSATSSTYAPDWNSGDTIENSADDGKVYAVNCEKTGGDIGSLWKTAWNYTGYLRYVAVTQNNH